VSAHGRKVRGLEEALPGIFLVQEPDVRPVAEALAVLHREREHPLEGRQLAVDGRRLGARLEPLIDIALNLGAIDAECLAAPEIRAEPTHVALGLLE
jgi:hypothetical protein